MRLQTTICLIAFLAVAHGQAGPFERGVALLKKQKFDAALHAFQQAAAAQPANAAVENLIGITLTQLQRLEEANQHYEKAIGIAPKFASPHKNRGFNRLKAREYGAAERDLSIALTLDPSDDFTRYYLGLVYLATDKDAQAVEQLKRVPALVANDPETRFELVRAYLRTGDVAAAEEHLQALHANGTLSSAQEFELAQQFSRRQRPQPALDCFRRVLALNPAAWGNRYNLALALLAAQQYGEARELLEKLASERPRDANVLTLLGSVYEATKKLPEALDAYQRSVAADPENSDRYLDYTRLLMDLDRFDESTQSIVQGLQFVKDSYALQIRLGTVMLMTGKYAGASEAFEKALQEHPEIPLAYVALARTYVKEGKIEEAVDLLARARAKLAPDFMLEYFYGIALSRLNRDTEALDALQKAGRMDPDSVAIHYELGRLQLRSERVEDARDEFEHVVRLNPQHANAWYQLSRIYFRLGDAARASEVAKRSKELKEKQAENALKAQRDRLNAFQTAVGP